MRLPRRLSPRRPLTPEGCLDSAPLALLPVLLCLAKGGALRVDWPDSGMPLVVRLNGWAVSPSAANSRCAREQQPQQPCSKQTPYHGRTGRPSARGVSLCKACCQAWQRASKQPMLWPSAGVQNSSPSRDSAQLGSQPDQVHIASRQAADQACVTDKAPHGCWHKASLQAASLTHQQASS